MFDVYLATLKKTNVKNEIRVNCQFRGQKWGSQAGVNPLDLRSRGLPCFRPPIFNLETSNSLLISFSKPFTVTVAVKQVNKEPFFIS